MSLRPFFLAMLCLTLELPALAQEAPEELVTVSGQVVHETDGTPVPGASVSLLGRSTTSDPQGRFTFSDVPRHRTTGINIRILNWRDEPVGCTTLDLPVPFYPVAAALGELVAVGLFTAEEDAPLVLSVAEVPATQVDAYCAECHKPNPCMDTPRYGEGGEEPKSLGGVGVRDEDLPAYKERLRSQPMDQEVFRGLRYQDAHPQAIDLRALLTDPEDRVGARFRMPERLSLLDGGRVTCDTCHTRHQPGADTPYLVMEFQSQNTLCLQCHL
jgi:predicted CXXCH cytochrome family protein